MIRVSVSITWGSYDTRYMTCGDNEQFTKSKVQRKNTKHEQSKHGPL